MTASFVARNIDPAAANAIHDDDVARQFGFEGALVPGVELWGRTASALGPAARRLALRFRRPVYDGERVEVEVEEDGGVVLRGPDGVARAVGSCAPSGSAPDPWLADGPARPLPGDLPPAEPESLPPGPLGTVREPVSRERNEEYAALVGDALPDPAVLHPGLLLRAVNLVLMRNVALGPWIHTASDALLLGPAPAGSVLEVRAVVRGTSVRSGNDEVRYDALVLADGAPVLQVDHTALFRLRGGPAG